MDLMVQGQGKVSLSKSDFKAAGGEGAVYLRGGVAYKLYGQSDSNGKFIAAPKKMIPTGKIQELSALTDPDIIRPQDILMDTAGTPIGYTMRALPDAIALCQTFTKAYRDRNHITPDHMLKLVQKLQAGVKHIHSKSILIVDLNEMNFLVDTGFNHVFFIDVDSYQTPHYPATAIMESIRDRHNKSFSQVTDWFSFGIVSFQMLVGIHPFKGKHDSLKTLDERMLGNVSVLNSAVKVPGAVQPFSVIPQVYLEWYKAVFERGERVAPPDGLTAVIVLAPLIKHVGGSDNFIIEEVGSYEGEIIAVVGNNVLTTEAVYAGTHRMKTVEAGAVLGVTPINQSPVVGRVECGTLILSEVNKRQELPLSLSADEIMSSVGRIYVRQADVILEVSFTELPTKTIASAKVVANVLGQATQLFDGMIVQNLLGATYLGLFSEAGKFHEIKVPELSDFRIADAKFERGVAVLYGEQKGKYDRLVLRFDDALQTYDIRKAEDVGLVGVNFTVLDTGIVVLMNESGELELFSKTRGSASVKVVADNGLNGDCRLFSRGAQTHIAQGGVLSKITMRKTIT